MFLVTIYAAIIGAAFGSFSTFLIHRFVNDKPILKSDISLSEEGLSPHRSACTSCNKKLGVLDLIPVLSWVFLKGRCSKCANKISPFYPLTEVFCAAFSVFTLHHFGITVEAVCIVLALPVLYTLFFVDLKTMYLPDLLMLSLALIGFALFIWRIVYAENPIEIVEFYGAGMLIFGVLSYALARFVAMLLKKPALGFGDVKFFAVSGLWLGLDTLPIFLILSGVFGVALGLFWRFVINRGQAASVFPFGPALIVSFLTLLFYHDEVINLLHL